MTEKTYKPVTSDGKVKVSINFDPVLLKKVDEDRRSKGLRRSGWFAIAAMSYLQKDEQDKKLRDLKTM